MTRTSFLKLSDANQPPFSFRGRINGFTGYGLHSCEIICYLLSRGLSVRVQPVAIDERFAPIPRPVRNAIVPGIPEEPWQLLLHAPNISPTAGKRTIWFTMWDSSNLPPDFVSRLNQAEGIIVPSRWNADGFRNCGVRPPIKIIPLGIDTEVFRPSPMAMEGPCVFGTGGRTDGFGERKRVQNVVDVFQKVFTSSCDVRLHVKIFPDSPPLQISDRRILVTRAFLSAEAMAAWFRGLTCFVSTSSGEAWGLFQHQALATGRPIISVQYGGVEEYFNKTMGYPLQHKLVAADGLYKDCGLWAEPDLESVAERMLQVYRCREEARLLGSQGSASMSELSWQNSNQKLLEILRELASLN